MATPDELLRRSVEQRQRAASITGRDETSQLKREYLTALAIRNELTAEKLARERAKQPTNSVLLEIPLYDKQIATLEKKLRVLGVHVKKKP